MFLVILGAFFEFIYRFGYNFYMWNCFLGGGLWGAKPPRKYFVIFRCIFES